MKKYIIEDSEVQRILSLHKTLKEQVSNTTPANQQAAPKVSPKFTFLKDAESKGCLSNGDVFGPLKGDKYYYRATTKSNKQVDFFDDLTYKFVDGSKQGNWSCKNLVASAQTTSGNNEVLRTTTESNILQQYKDMGFKTESELVGEEKNTLHPYDLRELYPKEFPQGQIVYFDVEILNDPVRKKKIPNKIISSVEKNIPDDQKNCKKIINEYYTNYMRKRPMAPSQFLSLKYQTQACKNEFYKNWSPFTGGRRLNKILDIMSGGQGGPSRRGEDAKWRLN